MIYIHTGQPGAGKTLFTLDIVRKRAEAENRAVYYHGIQILKPELFPGWELLEDPSKWMECPDGAIIVHDECQTLYRPRGTGSRVPDYVSRYETHRHNGWDIYLITQHPMLIDSNLRRLCGEHVHVVRAFGAKMATLHKWQEIKEQCDKTRADSVSETRAYPRELFDAYKSATIHTHKARIPPRVYLLLLMPVLLGLIGWWFYSWYSEKSAGPAISPGMVTQEGVPPGLVSRSSSARPVKTLEEWIHERTPRVEGLAFSAPRYDQLTEPVKAPYPAVCVAAPSKCKCYTQDATPLDVEDIMCRSFAKNGFFKDWDEKSTRDRDRRINPANRDSSA